MHSDGSRRGFLRTVAGLLGVSTGVRVQDSDRSDRSDNAAPVTAGEHGSLRWVNARHLRHVEGGRYGMTGLGKSTLLMNYGFARRTDEEWLLIDPAASESQ
jgi:hypothetical protein